jgi:hypothetical protein
LNPLASNITGYATANNLTKSRRKKARAFADIEETFLAPVSGTEAERTGKRAS